MNYRAVAVALMCLGSIPVLAQSQNEREGQPRPAGGSPMADALDTDKDGVISSEELKNAASTLLKLDKNKDGKLTEDEYRRAPGPGGPGGPGPGGPGPGGPGPGGPGGPGPGGAGPSYGNPVGSPGPNGPWSAADHDRDGLVTRQEMESFGKEKPHRDVERLMFHFDKADTNKDGSVNQSEIDAYATPIGSQEIANRKDGPGGPRGPGAPGAPDPKAMFSHSMAFDTDKDGKLNADELQKFIADFVQSQSRPGEPRGGTDDNRKTRPD